MGNKLLCIWRLFCWNIWGRKISKIKYLWSKHKPLKHPIARLRQWWRWKCWHQGSDFEKTKRAFRVAHFLNQVNIDPLTEEDLKQKANINFNTAWNGLLADSPKIDEWDDDGLGPSGEYCLSLNQLIEQRRGSSRVKLEQS